MENRRLKLERDILKKATAFFVRENGGQRPTESFWATLKKELMSDRVFATREEARAAIFEYIEVFYNRQRIHGSIGYVSPEQFEASRR